MAESKEYGYFTEYEKRNAEEQENIYKTLEEIGMDVIECLL